MISGVFISEHIDEKGDKTMSETSKKRIAHLVWATIAGTISFILSSVIIAIVMTRIDIVIFNIILAGGIGGLILGVLLMKRYNIAKMALAGLIAVPVGFGASFILAEGITWLISFLKINSDNFLSAGFGNILAIILMGIIGGALFGGIIKGRKAIVLFAIVGGVVACPFGFLVDAFNSGQPIKKSLESLFAVFGQVDLNFIAIVTALGIGFGLSLGLAGRSGLHGAEKDQPGQK